MQGNIIGQSGMFVNDSLFPIYQQLNQPIEYNGIWIKTEDNLKDVYFQTDDVRESIDINSLPYNFKDGRAASIGNNIYMFGGNADNDAGRNAYKYNSIEGTYTKLTNIPGTHVFEGGHIAVTDNKIYLIGSQYAGGSGGITAFNPETDTYTKINSSSLGNASGGAATAIGNDIYLFGGNDEYYSKKTRKFNILTNERTFLKDLEDKFAEGIAIVKNSNEIYVFGLRSYNYQYISEYNIQTNEFENKSNILNIDRHYGTKLKKAVYFTTDEFTKFFLEGDSYYNYKKRNVS